MAVADKTSLENLQDHLFISCVPEDGALADWLTRKLSAEGYAVWCERFKLLGGESYPDDIDEAIKHRTFRMVSLYSKASLRNPEVMRQRSLALNLSKELSSDFLIPINVDGVRTKQLDRLTSNLAFIPFEKNWATGLNQLLKKLTSVSCPKPLYNGKNVAAEYFVPKDIVSDQPEELVSNCLVIEKIPVTIYQFEASKEVVIS
ncbi:MAG: toll/interleukin-1 receptor domain-containing protein [Caldilineaceae bacterium]